MRQTLLALALALLLAPHASAQDGPHLDGFRIGMSVDEARVLAPDIRRPADPSAPFLSRAAHLIELGGDTFLLDLIFVRGQLERMSFESHDPIVRDPQICLRGLDAIVADLETQLGPFSSPAVEGEASGLLFEANRTALGSEVRHYRNGNGVITGVASIAGAHGAEARVGIPPAGRERWSCIFRLKVGVTPPPPTAPLVDDAIPRLRNVIWIERPTGADFARVYPTTAVDLAQWGDVVLDCTVGDGGAVSCNVMSEAPEGWGFGAAALELSREFRIAPVTRDNVPTNGGRALVPIRFRVE